MTIAFNYPIICMHFRFSCMFSFRSLVGLAVEEYKKIIHLAADFKLCQKLNIKKRAKNQRANFSLQNLPQRHHQHNQQKQQKQHQLYLGRQAGTWMNE